MNKQKYVAFLRGINVGGHHKVPMAQLRQELERMGFENVVTILNSGNILFEADDHNPIKLEQEISEHLQNVFGFSVPTLLRKSDIIFSLNNDNPFRNIEITENTRLYVSFLREEPETDLPIPWSSEDGSYKIIKKKDKTVISVLDLSKSKTPKAMEALERCFGKNITTRNWNTILRLIKKLELNH